MFWHILADCVLAVHATLVLFNVFGGFFCWRRPAWRVVHLFAVAVVLLFLVTTGGCPLTDLEIYLLQKGNPGASYQGGFIAHYLERLIYWEVPPGTIGAATAVWFLGWLGFYAWLWRREKRGSVKA